MIKIIFILLLLFSYPTFSDVGKDSGKPIPRFISLKSSEANMRVGPSTKYPKILQYIFPTIPLKVIDEEDVWRKVVDWENNEGWIHSSLLSNIRFGIVEKQSINLINIYNKPNGKIIGKIGSGNIVKLKKCNNNWCKINIDKNRGWIKKKYIWGVNKNENFDFTNYLDIIRQ